MRHGSRGSYGARARLALGGILVAFAAACGGSGGSGGGGSGASFSAQLLPVELMDAGAGFGNVAFASDGDALVVGGGSDSLFRVSRADGSVTEIASGVVPGGGVLLSVVDPGTGVFYVGDDLGDIYEVDGGGGSTLLEPTGAGAIHGLVMAANGFGDFQGSLIAATETGIIEVDPDLGGTSTIADPPGVVYSDLEFRNSTLFAVDYTNGEIDRVASDGAVTTFAAAGLSSPDGIAVDLANGRLLVADEGSDTLKSVSLATSQVTEIGAYPFDSGAEPSGLAFDGVRNLLLVTEGSLVARGVGIPGYDAGDFPVDIVGATSSVGSLVLDRQGDLIGTANGTNANRVFRIPRNGGAPTTLAADLGDPAGGEGLTAVTHDAATQTTYVGSSQGNVFAVNAGGAALFTSLPGSPVVTGLAIAPESFDATLGGRLVASTATSGIFSIDLAAPAPSAFATGVGTLSDLVFGADGTLYVLENVDGQILTVTAGNQVDTVVSGLSRPDGIAIDEGGGRFLVVDAGAGQLLEVPMGGGGSATVLAAFFAVGPLPSGVAFDGLGTALVLHGDETATVDAVTVFP